VLELARDDEFVRIDDDVFPAVVAIRIEPECRGTGLHRDQDAHQRGYGEAGGADDAFFREEHDDALAQAPDLVFGVDRQKWQLVQRLPLQRLGDCRCRQRPPTTPVADRFEHRSPAANLQLALLDAGGSRSSSGSALVPVSMSITIAVCSRKRSVASLSGNASTPRSLRSIERDRISAAPSVLPTISSCFFVLARMSPNVPNSVFTAASNRHTSPERRSMASVRKPICRLFRIAANVVGPARVT